MKSENGFAGGWRFAFDIAVTGVAVVAAIWLVQTGAVRIGQPASASLAVPKTPVALGDAPFEGASSAPVILLEFSDFQCPYCSRFVSDVLPTLRSDFVAKGSVQLFFHHLPLAAIHPLAGAAAVSAECARQQGRFWPAHDAMFKAPELLAPISRPALASAAGLDPFAFQQCVEQADHGQIERDTRLADELRITGTPTFMIGRRVEGDQVRIIEALRGAQPLSSFESAVARVMSAK